MWSKTYAISPAQEAMILAKLELAGIVVDPTKAGSTTQHGITLTWTAVQDGQITVDASSNPFGMVGHKLDALFAS